MIDEQTLTLYYYDDGLSDAERREVEAALKRDHLLAARYHALSRELDTLGIIDDDIAPDQVRATWHAAIERAASRRSATSRQPVFSIAWIGALAAALVIGVAIGMQFGGEPPLDEPIGIATLPPTRVAATPAAFRRGLQAHLMDAELELARISEQPADKQSVLLMQIVAQNRIFERAAEANNAPDIARLMRAFEPILVRLAEQDIAPEDSEALREQLAFELKAMLTKMQRAPSQDSQSI